MRKVFDAHLSRYFLNAGWGDVTMSPNVSPVIGLKYFSQITARWLSDIATIKFVFRDPSFLPFATQASRSPSPILRHSRTLGPSG